MNRDVTIKPFRDASGKIDFQMFEGKSTQPTDTLTFDKTKDNMKKSEVYKVDFQLENAPDTNLIFLQHPTKKEECMWVAKGSKSSPPSCPTNGVSDPEFTVDNVSNTTLRVTNKDMDECKYKFVLNFVDQDDGGKIVAFDPIYDNKNGGSQAQLLSLNASTVTVLAIGAVALVGLLYLTTR